MSIKDIKGQKIRKGDILIWPLGWVEAKSIVLYKALGAVNNTGSGRAITTFAVLEQGKLHHAQLDWYGDESVFDGVGLKIPRALVYPEPNLQDIKAFIQLAGITYEGQE